MIMLWMSPNLLLPCHVDQWD